VSDDAAVLWLDQGEGREREQAARALAEWARTRGIRLRELEETTPALEVDLGLAERVEKELDRAREAIGANDADGAERALARAIALLREHPELPQAAWLRAETERTWSARWLQVEPRDERRARIAWEEAEALDGGRAAGIGEMTFPPRPHIPVTIAVAGSRAHDVEVRLDGARLEGAETRDGAAVYRVEVAPAEHQLTATAGGRVVFASWLAFAASSAANVRVHIGDAGSCSREQLAEVKRAGSRVDARGVMCPRWIAAMPSERGDGVLVARCARDACGPLLEWRVPRLADPGPPQPPPRPGWPAWATWTLLGIGAATATSIAFVASGVFESRPVEPRFVVGGARQE
jgi:hypothetical protein